MDELLPMERVKLDPIYPEFIEPMQPPFTIEDHVPITDMHAWRACPLWGRGPQREFVKDVLVALEKLKVGQSFLIPLEGRAAGNVHVMLSFHKKKLPHKVFISRTIGRPVKTGVRVWCIEIIEP
jgi:hypothetical protein